MITESQTKQILQLRTKLKKIYTSIDNLITTLSELDNPIVIETLSEASIDISSALAQLKDTTRYSIIDMMNTISEETNFVEAQENAPELPLSYTDGSVGKMLGRARAVAIRHKMNWEEIRKECGTEKIQVVRTLMQYFRCH